MLLGNFELVYFFDGRSCIIHIKINKLRLVINKLRLVVTVIYPWSCVVKMTGVVAKMAGVFTGSLEKVFRRARSLHCSGQR